LNLAPNGTRTLVALRHGLFRYLKEVPELKAVDNDLKHLFSSWFNRGFLVLRRIDWNTPALLLEKIIQYEAVHEINGWEDLRRRVNPSDRRCFAFFHPALGEDPLIFVEVALSRETQGSIAEVLDENRPPDKGEKPTTAVFYSISNCQDGLRGVSFGSFLIKQVVRELSQELPSLNRFVTLSPVPGFVHWLRSNGNEAFANRCAAALELIDQPDWVKDVEKNMAAKKLLMPLVAHYLVRVQHKNLPLDPVARFHIGNGSSLDRINWAADISALAMKQSAGIMVNYLYDLDKIEVNHEACAEKGIVTASKNVTSLL
jgi:malonyl-CoA decarboxylase